MEKILNKFKNENKILLMLAFFSISKGLWENFRQLWLQDNNLNATEISQILGTATFCCVIILIILAKQLSLNRIKKIISISIFVKIISLIALYVLNHTGDNILINLFIILDTICQNIIIISIYPFIVSIKKDDKLYSKRKLVEYLFSDIGILVGGILIGRTIGNLLVDYNICLLVSVIFLVLSFIIVINIKNIKVSKEKVELKKTIQHIIKDKIDKNIEVIVNNTICNATRIRQEETEKIAKEVDGMVIIGGRKSSNTNKLYQISLENCKNVVMVENAQELKENLDNFKMCKKIGIMAGASTPEESIEEIVNIVKNM